MAALVVHAVAETMGDAEAQEMSQYQTIIVECEIIVPSEVIAENDELSAKFIIDNGKEWTIKIKGDRDIVFFKTPYFRQPTDGLGPLLLNPVSINLKDIRNEPT